MSIVEIHPEELFDKLAEGTLSELEQERLSLHLKGCAVCRFEYGARLDFEREVVGSEERIAPTLPLRPLPRTVAATRRRRPRLLVWGLAAALLISASGALASATFGGKPAWRAVAAMFVSASAPAANDSLPTKRAQARAAERAVPAPPSASPTVHAPVLDTPFAEVALAEAALPEAALAEAPRRAPPMPGTPSKSRATDAAKARLATTSLTPASSSAEPARKPAVAADSAAPEARAAKLFAEANQARRAGQVGRASGLYHLLQDQYPGSPEAELSRVTLATLLLNAGDASGALAGFERYLAGRSRALEAEALLGRARALQRLGNRQLEAAAWREVQRRFPGSVYARQATERLTALGPP